MNPAVTQAWAETVQAWAEVAGDVVAGLALIGVVVTLLMQRADLGAQREQLALQQAEFDRVRREAERRQAMRIDTTWTSTNINPPWFEAHEGTVLRAAAVTNNSGRPIRHIKDGSRAELSQPYKLGDAYQFVSGPDMTVQHDTTPARGREIDIVQAGESYLIIFAWVLTDRQASIMAVRFFDDDGREWQINPDKTVVKVDLAEWGSSSWLDPS